MNSKKKVFVDVTPLAAKNVSGVGHVLENVLWALLHNDTYAKSYDTVLFSGRMKRKTITLRGKHYPLRQLPCSVRLLRLLNTQSLLPPVDRILGRGMYLFFDFYNLPVSKHSTSMNWVHDTAYNRYPMSVSAKLRRKLTRHMSNWLERSDKILTGTNFVKQEIIDLYGTSADKIEVIGGGVDKNFSKKQPANKDAGVLKKYQIPQHYILHVGNFEPRKNHKTLLEAYIRLPSTLQKAYPLVLVGGSRWNDEDTESLLQELQGKGTPIIRPDGFISDNEVVSLLRRADLFVFPSLYEGLGIPPLEALACGTRVIVSHTAASREVLGKAVPSFDATHTQELSRLMQDALVSNKGRIRKESVEKVLAKHSWEAAAQRLLKVLNTV